MHNVDRKKFIGNRRKVASNSAKRTARVVWGHAPPEKFRILGLLRSFLGQFSDKN